ncbi:ECF transporter S component [Aeribacillus pallidus]|uniref:ECF transporter S component n=1 Tax=Aeribacillus pallidus TaxID=33936 RepID=UPI001DAF0007|nr:ECF transporter S component [Bacillus sp. (in: firmicutes)]
MNNGRLKRFVSIGMLSSIAYVLMMLNFPFPGFPTFLLVDFSDIPALVGAILFGPLAGIIIELIKNILDYFITGSETGIPIGHAANFTAGIFFILPTYYIYQRMKSTRGMTVALVVGTLSMAVSMSILNYFVFLPAYTFFLNMPAMSGPEARQFIVSAIFPFNVVKGLLITFVFTLIFIRLQYWLNKQSVIHGA